MISYFPELYPDELVYSWFCRFYVHAGFQTHKMALQLLYSKRSDDPSKEFIGSLNETARTLIQRMCPLDTLVLEHTMFPQYARFLPVEDQKRALHRLEHESWDPHHLLPIPSRSGNDQFLRFCPVCVEEDRRNYGETYWHRKHQIRNMLICPIHHCKLVCSGVLAKSEHSDMFYPAETNVHVSCPVWEENAALIDFSGYLSAVFEAPFHFKRLNLIHERLYQGMGGTQYLVPSGNSRRTKQLSDDMQQYYKAMGLHNIATMNQIQRVLLGSRFDFSTVCQIAFFLGLTVQDLVAPVSMLQQAPQKQPVSPVDWDRLDAEKVPELERIAKELYTGNSEHRPERISERLVYRELGLLKHQLDKLPRCRAVCEQYVESYPELWARRLVWAYHKLQTDHNGTICWSDIRSLAGVKKKHFGAVYPYLLKHGDGETAEAITQLVGSMTEEPCS